MQSDAVNTFSHDASSDEHMHASLLSGCQHPTMNNAVNAVKKSSHYAGNAGSDDANE